MLFYSPPTSVVSDKESAINQVKSWCFSCCFYYLLLLSAFNYLTIRCVFLLSCFLFAEHFASVNVHHSLNLEYSTIISSKMFLTPFVVCAPITHMLDRCILVNRSWSSTHFFFSQYLFSLFLTLNKFDLSTSSLTRSYVFGILLNSSSDWKFQILYFPLTDFPFGSFLLFLFVYCHFLGLLFLFITGLFSFTSLSRVVIMAVWTFILANSNIWVILELTIGQFSLVNGSIFLFLCISDTFLLYLRHYEYAGVEMVHSSIFL